MLKRLPIAMIYRARNARPTDKENLKVLMQSMAEVGLINPIFVKKTKRIQGGGVMADAYEVVAGNHRLKAAEELNWKEIDCNVVELDDLRFELATIDENIMRADLTPAQAAVANARRKEIYELLHPEATPGAIRAAGMNKSIGRGDVAAKSAATSFTTATAKATGQSERTVRNHTFHGEKIGQMDLDAITGTSLDKTKELDALARMTPEERKPLIERAKAGEKVSAMKNDKPAHAQEGDDSPFNEAEDKFAGNLEAAAMKEGMKVAASRRKLFFDKLRGAVEMAEKRVEINAGVVI